MEKGDRVCMGVVSTFLPEETGVQRLGWEQASALSLIRKLLDVTVNSDSE